MLYRSKLIRSQGAKNIYIYTLKWQNNNIFIFPPDMNIMKVIQFATYFGLNSKKIEISVVYSQLLLLKHLSIKN